MANQIKMAVRDTIVTLWERGWSQRRIARELGIDRETVSRYVRLARQEGAGQGARPPGCAHSAGSAGEVWDDGSKPAKALAGLDAGELSEASAGDGGYDRVLTECDSAAVDGFGGSKPAKALTGDQTPVGPESVEAAGHDTSVCGPKVCGPNAGEVAAGDTSPGGAYCAVAAAVGETGGESNPSEVIAGRLGAEGSDLSGLRAGDERIKEANPTETPAGGQAEEGPKPAKALAGNQRSRSACEPLRGVILEKLDKGLSAQRIWQDLVSEHGFAGSYCAVQRYVCKLGASRFLPFRRMECEPGQEAQIDFGKGATVIGPDGKRRRCHVLRIVLSHSRKAYSEAVWRQTTENFIRVLENAFHYFGGVPKTLVPDNLKAAVAKADWYDPELNPKINDFCRHYGTVLLPAKPGMARHKGKVESGIKYVRGNALKGRTFASLTEQNRYLLDWEEQVADHRIHGTTRKQVAGLFQQHEKAALGPLPPTRFPCFEEGQRSVHRDGHVEVKRAYYSVPPEYVSRQVWVRWDSRVVRIYNERFEQIAIHARHEPGRFSTKDEHIASEKISNVERGAEYLLSRAARIGPHTGRWARAMLDARGIQGVRVLQGLFGMTRRYSAEVMEQACELALTHGSFRLRALRRLADRPSRQEQMEFIQEHPLIRGMEEYGRIIRVSFRRDGNE